ncbi:Putative transposon-encoded protein [Thermoplasmatales archaeon]|nr:Putative transposon-encoded protein [Thermoplasmatales archaeon]
MDNHVTMVRKLELETGILILSEDEIEGFLERTVTPIEMSGKADNPRRYIGRRVYVIITKNEGPSGRTEKRNSVPHSSFHADSRG